MNLGTTSIDIVSDGTLMLDGGSLFGQIPKAQWEVQVKPDRRNRIRMALNCLLIQAPGANILVDTGCGSKRIDRLKETCGLVGSKLPARLKELGLQATDIDYVVLTNLQFDHGGGCTKLDRKGFAVPTFPKAQYLVQRTCWEEANHPNERFAHAFYEDDFVPLEEKGLLTLLDGDYELIPGVNIKVTGGPMKGHQIVLVERGSEKIAYLGDLVPTRYHLPLSWIQASDQDPDETLGQKRDVLRMVVHGGWLVIFGHGFDHPAGYVQQRNGSTHLVPVTI